MPRCGMAGELLMLCPAFSSSVMRETRSCARAAGERCGFWYGSWPVCAKAGALRVAARSRAEKNERIGGRLRRDWALVWVFLRQEINGPARYVELYRAGGVEVKRCSRCG